MYLKIDGGRAASVSSTTMEAEREEKESKKRMLKQFLTQHYNGVRVSEEVGSEMAYLLPWSRGSSLDAGKHHLSSTLCTLYDLERLA